MKKAISQIISLSVSACLIFPASITYAQPKNGELRSIWERLGCILGFVEECGPDQKIAEGIAAVTTREPDFSLLVQRIRNDYEQIKESGSPALAEEARSMLKARVEDSAAALGKDLPEDSKSVISSCLDTVRALATTASEQATPPGTTPANLPDINKCKDALLGKEKEVATKLNKIDKDLQTIDSDIREKERDLRASSDDEESTKILNLIRQKEQERDQKRRERERLENQRVELQKMRMTFGLALVVLALSVGGPVGLLLLMNGLNMMAGPSGGSSGGPDDGGRDNHPSGGDLRQEYERSKRNNQGSDGSQDVLPPLRDNTDPEPEIVQTYDSPESGYDVVPVNANRKSNQGYFLTRNQETGIYTLRHSDKTDWFRRIDPKEVKPYQPEHLPVPTPFVITNFESITTATNGDCDIGIRVQGVNKILYLVQNPKGYDLGWYLANVQIER